MVNTKKVLIADDSEINRSILCDILENEYEVLAVNDGEQALQTLIEHDGQIALMLLDIHMPIKDGFYVLKEMRANPWGVDVPVIIISSETSVDSIRKGFSYGVSDYINKPFHHEIIQQRVRNTIMLNAKLDQLKNTINVQMLENEKNNTMMVNMLSSVVEFRNGESGLHVIRIRAISEILLEELVNSYPEYGLTNYDIQMISNAAALHDIGKISIPEEILNKPGKLSEEEYNIMKLHTVIADEMIQNLKFGKHEALVLYCQEICRWHHERWDGNGYPDGLKGNEIPISAQVVSLADVYDALVSKRVYKQAYSHAKAMEMILHNECGVFNKDLIDCLLKIADTLEERIDLYCRKQEDIFNIYHLVKKDVSLKHDAKDNESHQLHPTNEKQKMLVFDTLTGEYMVTKRLLFHEVPYACCIFLRAKACMEDVDMLLIKVNKLLQENDFIFQDKDMNFVIYIEEHDAYHRDKRMQQLYTLCKDCVAAVYPENGASFLALYDYAQQEMKQCN